MSDDIPQDQVEAVAREVLTVIRANTVTFNDVGLSLTIARAAIRVLTPLIAAVERERCKQLWARNRRGATSMAAPSKAL